MLLAALLALQAPGGAACAPSTTEPAIKLAIDQLKRKDLAAAKATVTPIAACPVVDAATHLAHVMVADLASREGDWPRVRQMITTAGFHPEVKSGALAQFLAMRADQGMGDETAFTADRDLTLAANDARLTAAGEKIETFRVPTGSVSAYRTAISQGGFKRVYEFVAKPDDKGAYPVTIMLTDDEGAASIAKQLGIQSGAAPMFLDLYSCNGHQTLPPVAQAGGGAPNYATLKTRVVETLSRPGILAASAPPEKGVCYGVAWLVPGFDARPR